MAERIRPEWAITCVLALSILGVFTQVAQFGFVSYDDGMYLFRNGQVQSGLSWDTVRWAFTTTLGGNWHPVTWLSHALDASLFGMDAGKHHLVNVGFHFANTLLLNRMLRRLTGEDWLSGIVAFLFAVHPLHVESVAWISERKDVLSTFFGLSGILAWLHYVKRPSILNYLGVMSLMTLSVMSKSMWVTLPVLLLLLDHWPLGRLQTNVDGDSLLKIAIRRILEKIPLFMISITFGLIALASQRSMSALASFEGIPFSLRACNAAVSLCEYLKLMLFPAGLAAFYPHPMDGIPLAYSVGSMILLAYLTWIAVSNWRRHPYLLTGWGWYLCSILPVAGLIQVGSQARADRYTYLPLVGIFLCLVWGGKEVLRRHPVAPQYVKSAGALVGVVLIATAAVQVGYWRDSKTLWNRALQVTERNNWLAYQGLADALVAEKRLAEAAEAYSRALENLPENAGNRFFLFLKRGDCLDKLGDKRSALKEFRQAQQLEPDYAMTYYWIALLLLDLGRPEEAVPYLNRVLVAKPGELGTDPVFARKIIDQARRRLDSIRARTLSATST